MHPQLMESDFRREEMLRLAEQHRIQRNLIKEALAYLAARKSSNRTEMTTSDAEEITEVRRSAFASSNKNPRLATEG